MVAPINCETNPRGGGELCTVIHIRCEPGACIDNNVKLVGINKAEKLGLLLPNRLEVYESNFQGIAGV